MKNQEILQWTIKFEKLIMNHNFVKLIINHNFVNLIMNYTIIKSHNKL
jgi:hypothetical protein